MLPLSVILLSSVLLLAMVLNLVLKPVYSARLTTACMGIAVIGGLFIYGIGYMEATGDFLLSVIRTPLSVRWKSSSLRITVFSFPVRSRFAV